MKNITLWIVIGAIAVFVLGMFGGLFLPFGWNNATYGYGCAGGYDMMGYGGSMLMMGGWRMMPFGFLSMLFMWLIPLAVLALVVGGIFWVVRALMQKQA